MTVKNGGPVRGLIGRWVMRFEAAGQIISITAQVTTAGSAVSGVLLLGTGIPSWLVVAILCGFVGGGFGFAYVYVEWGIFNRKNQEKNKRGHNYAKPQNAIDDAIIARAILAGERGEPLDADTRDVIAAESLAGYHDYEDGIDLSA